MKKECTYTRRLLSRYLAGHLFAPQRRRIERHLAVCPVCRSEFDAVRGIRETRRILRDITPPEGLARPLQAGAASVAALKRLLYRPLWLVVIVAATAAAYVYVIHPLLHDPDLERLDASAPPAAQQQSASTATHAPEPKKASLSAPASSSSASPLMITITLDRESEQASIRRINEAMKEHSMLRTLQFSDSSREISGSLTAGELFTFFDRIEGTGKVTYKRSRLAAAGEGDLVPFIMRLKTRSAPSRPAGTPAQHPAEKPVEKVVEKPGDSPADTQPTATDAGPPPAAPQGQ